MATNNEIAGAEPSTVTFKLATVTQNWNSTVRHQELQTIAGAESTLEIARVMGAAPASTDMGLVVRQVGHSTIVTVAAMPAGSSGVTVNAFAAGLVSSAMPAAGSSGLLVRPVWSSTNADQPVSAAVTSFPANSSQVEVTNTVTVAGNSTVHLGSVAAGLLSSAAAAGNSSALLVRVVGGASSAGDFVTRPVFPSTAADNPVLATIAGAAVSSAAPAAGSSALVVRVVGYSTTAQVSSVGGVVSVSPNSTGWANAAGFSVDSSNFLNVNASFTGSTDVSISKFPAGLVSSAAPAGNSSALLVRIAGGVSSAADFVSNVSSVAGVVSVSPNSTAWVKNAGLSVDSSNYLNVNASFTGSTDVSISKFPAGLVSSAAPAGNSSALVVRIAGGVSSAADFVSNVSSVAGVVSVSPNSTGWANAAGFSVDSSNFLNVNASFTGSTSITITGPVSTAAPATSDTGVVVRQVGYSTIVSVAAMPANSSIVAVGSFASGLISSAAPAAGSSGLVVWPVGYSTIVTVAAMPANSSQVEVRAMPANSSVVALGSVAAGLLSSAAPTVGSSALLVRQVNSSLQSTTVVVTSSASTALYTLLSSVAGNQRVFGYFIGASTSGNHSTMLIGNSTTPSRWGVIMSSGVWGANLTVSPPGFLFETGAGNALQVRIESASTAIIARVSLSYFID